MTRKNVDKKLIGDNRTGTMKENRAVGGVWQNKEKEGTALACSGKYIDHYF